MITSLMSLLTRDMEATTITSNTPVHTIHPLDTGDTGLLQDPRQQPHIRIFGIICWELLDLELLDPELLDPEVEMDLMMDLEMLIPRRQISSPQKIS